MIVRIYSDIRSWECNKLFEYSNIFKYSYNFQYKYLLGHLFVWKFLYKNIWIFVRVHFFDADIFGYLFVSIFLQMSHSGLSTCTRCLTPLPPPQVPTRHQTVNLDSSEVYSSCLGMVVCIFGNFEHIFSSICFERTNV